MIHNIFYSLINEAIIRMQKYQLDVTLGRADNPVKFGNVNFWISDTGENCYDIPVHQWDEQGLIIDLQRWL